MQPWKENEQFFDKEVWTVMMMVVRMCWLQFTSCKVFLRFDIWNLDVLLSLLWFQRYIFSKGLCWSGQTKYGVKFDHKHLWWETSSLYNIFKSCKRKSFNKNKCTSMSETLIFWYILWGENTLKINIGKIGSNQHDPRMTNND